MGAFLRTTIASIVLILPISAQAQPMSSYQNSCRHVRAEAATLYAQCRRVNGTYNDSAIEIRGIANTNGNLQFTSMAQPSSYQLSCRRIRATGNTLTAACRRIDGSYHLSSTMIPGIANINGNLQYQ